MNLYNAPLSSMLRDCLYKVLAKNLNQKRKSQDVRCPLATQAFKFSANFGCMPVHPRHPSLFETMSIL